MNTPATTHEFEEEMNSKILPTETENLALHAEIADLQAQLEAVGAGGVGRLVPDVSIINEGAMAKTIKDCMEQAQVFASTWSLVGRGAFASTIEEANEEKAELEAMLREAITCSLDQSWKDAYKGAREDLAIWKKRALEAEELSRKFIADINGRTFVGEPAAQAQALLAQGLAPGWKAVPVESTRAMLDASMGVARNLSDWRNGLAAYRAMLATAPQPPAHALDAWQPIATAPKDGSEILLRSAKGRIANGMWSAANERSGFWAWAYVHQEPAEWMPLPSAQAQTMLAAAPQPQQIAEPERQDRDTRKPLTDDELDLMCEKALFCRISFQQFARSIEAAHGITEQQGGR